MLCVSLVGTNQEPVGFALLRMVRGVWLAYSLPIAGKRGSTV